MSATMTESRVSIDLQKGRFFVPLDGGVADLRLARLETPSATAGASDTAADSPVAMEAPEVVKLVRAVLAAGHALDFEARGQSMRPTLPDGSVLRVEPRSLDTIRRGDVLFFTPDESHLVAHRVIGQREDAWLVRGDTSERIDQVTQSQFLGVVVGRVSSHGNAAPVVVSIHGGTSRAKGRLTSFLYRPLLGAVRLFWVRPLRASPLLRRTLGAGLAIASSLLRKIEIAGFLWRQPLDRWRAGLLTTAQKDEGRRRLYAGKAIQDFTALDENIEAGLTLIEEVLLRRHPLPSGPVLVIGCGPGRECVALAKLGHTVVGIDREPRMLDLARSLSERHGVSVEYRVGEAVGFDLDDARFGSVLILSGLYNMILPASARIRMLEDSRRHLLPGGAIYLTFLSDYLQPGTLPPISKKTVLKAVNPDHEIGDLYLYNEAVHIHPHPNCLRNEAEAAGLETSALWRDQRAYDRLRGQIRGYAVLKPR